MTRRLPLILTLLGAPLAAQGVVEREVVVMATGLRVEVEAASRARALVASEALVAAVEAVERRLSVWRADSDVARVNAAAVGQPVAVELATHDDLRWALAFGGRTGRAFDITSGPLVEAYGLRGEPRWPTEAARRAALCAMGPRHFDFVDGRIIRRHASAALDCDAFGKGIGLDRGAEAAMAAGATRVFCDFGGQLLNVGPAAGPVDLVIADPDDRSRAIGQLRLAPGRSAATSGNGERRLAVDGRPLGHLVDPRSGQPARDFGSVTVMAAGAATADAAATALFVLGPERGMKVATELGLEVVFAVRDAAGGVQLHGNITQ